MSDKTRLMVESRATQVTFFEDRAEVLRRAEVAVPFHHVPVTRV